MFRSGTAAMFPVCGRCCSIEGVTMRGVAFCGGRLLLCKVLQDHMELFDLHYEFGGLKQPLCLVIPAKIKVGGAAFAASVPLSRRGHS